MFTQSDSRMPTHRHHQKIRHYGYRTQPAEPARLVALGHDYVCIWDCYEQGGGLCKLSTLIQEISGSTRWHQIPDLLEDVNDGKLVAFPVCHQVWLPRFQFDAGYGVLNPVRRSVALLRCHLDSVEMALWFCTPNELLEGEPPMDAVHSIPESVVLAARARRLEG
ncbi:MAG: hypothetical protein EON56_03920 [Alphaproteobacteria bacterium]|nr:MAG: hypothetical protein EON56_03920 [Alphaproteobacteria bacterium]